MLNVNPFFFDVILIVPVGVKQVGCLTSIVGVAGGTPVFGTEVPIPGALVHPSSVVVTE
jgi:hypothetical protein